MPEQETDSAVVDGATTPAETGAAETTTATETETQTENPLKAARDPWADFGKDVGSEPGKQDEGADTASETETEAPATTEEGEVDKTDADTDEEEDLLSDLFKDADGEEGKSEEGKPDDAPESEEDKLDKADPKEMAAAQRNESAKKYLERTERYATPLKDLKAGKLKPMEALAALEPVIGAEPLNQIKQAAAHALVDEFPDQTFQRAYAIKMLAKDPTWDPKTATIPSLDDIIAGPVVADTPEVDVSELTQALNAEIEWDWRDENLDENFADDREKAMAKTIRELESAAKKAAADKATAEEKVQAAEAKAAEATTSKETDEQKAITEGLNKRITDFRSSIDSKILPFVLRDTGLEVSPDDTPEIVALKSRMAEMYQGTEYEQANNIPSQFVSFLENEWSGKDQIESVYTRVVDNLLKAEMAARVGDKDAEKKALDDVKEDRIPLFTLVSKANRDFKTRYVKPLLAPLGSVWEKKAQTVNTGRDRKEIVSSAAPARQAAPKKQYDTADAIWDGMVTEEQENHRAAVG